MPALAENRTQTERNDVVEVEVPEESRKQPNIATGPGMLFSTQAEDCGVVVACNYIAYSTFNYVCTGVSSLLYSYVYISQTYSWEEMYVRYCTVFVWKREDGLYSCRSCWLGPLEGLTVDASAPNTTTTTLLLSNFSDCHYITVQTLFPKYDLNPLIMVNYRN